jgi:hypothetical protein
MEARGDALGAGAAVGWEACEQLELRSGGFGADAEILCGAPCSREQQHLGFAGREAGELGAIAFMKRETARAATLGIDRNARGAELVDVAIDGADRNLELARQRIGRQAAAHLKHDQDRKKTAGAHFVRLKQKS